MLCLWNYSKVQTTLNFKWNKICLLLVLWLFVSQYIRVWKNIAFLIFFFNFLFFHLIQWNSLVHEANPWARADGEGLFHLSWIAVCCNHINWHKAAKKTAVNKPIKEMWQSNLKPKVPCWRPIFNEMGQSTKCLHQFCIKVETFAQNYEILAWKTITSVQIYET